MAPYAIASKGTAAKSISIAGSLNVTLPSDHESHKT
jgi:hypothetical protein